MYFLLHHFNLVVALGTLLYLTFFFLYGHLVPYSTTEEATVPVVKNVISLTRQLTSTFESQQNGFLTWPEYMHCI